MLPVVDHPLGDFFAWRVMADDGQRDTVAVTGLALVEQPLVQLRAVFATALLVFKDLLQERGLLGQHFQAIALANAVRLLRRPGAAALVKWRRGELLRPLAIT